MTKREVFKKNLCDELGLVYSNAIGETDDIIVLDVMDNDVAAKGRVKAWLNAHHWVLDNVDERTIKISLGSKDVIKSKVVTYRHNNHKIIISCN